MCTLTVSNLDTVTTTCRWAHSTHQICTAFAYYILYVDPILVLLQIPESFADCLGGLLSVVGQNLSLKLEAMGETVVSAVHANRTVNWTTANRRSIHMQT